MTLVEYLYVDERRLASYFEQISPVVAYDGVPSWSAGVGLTGIHVDRGQEKHARAFTNH